MAGRTNADRPGDLASGRPSTIPSSDLLFACVCSAAALLLRAIGRKGEGGYFCLAPSACACACACVNAGGGTVDEPTDRERGREASADPPPPTAAAAGGPRAPGEGRI